MIHSPWFRLVALSAVVLPALADQVSKQALIEEMLTLTKAESLIRNVLDQQLLGVDQKIRRYVQSDSRLQPHAKDLEPLLVEFEGKAFDVLRGALSWTTFKPQLVALYRDVFSEEELAGIVAFYKTPTGRALVNKMPELTSRTMKLVQEKVQAMQPELIPLTRELDEKAAKIAGDKAK